MSNKITLGLKGLFSLLFLLIGGMKAIQNPEIVASLTRIGMPTYLALILGVAYIAGVVGIWQKVSSDLRIWAYAGFVFALLGAVSSHILSGDPITAALPAFVLLVFAGALYWLDVKKSA